MLYKNIRTWKFPLFSLVCCSVQSLSRVQLFATHGLQHARLPCWSPAPDKTQFPPQSVSPIRKLPQGSYLSPSEDRQNENHSNRKLTKLITWTTACLAQWNYELCLEGATKIDRSWWRVLTERGPLEKRIANHFSILAFRTPWTVPKFNTVLNIIRENVLVVGIWFLSQTGRLPNRNKHCKIDSWLEVAA